ncbi:MAG: hypothetical protein ACXQS7_02660 [Candidatus Syntropharchaeia archaeon]
MKVELIVDGKRIEINNFVQRIIGGSILGAISSLHGVSENCRKVEIKIER